MSDPGSAPATDAPAADDASLEVLAIRFGTLTAPRSRLFFGYSHYGEPDAEEVLDYFFWVVRHPDWTMVVDTGFNAQAGERRGRTQLISPEAALEEVGINPLGVDHVVLTHFHYDHIGNVDLFPNASLWVATREYEFFTSPSVPGFQIATHVEDDDVASVVAAHEAGRVRFVDHSARPVPGVSLIVVDGHAPGQLIVTTGSGDGMIVLASDAVHLYEELDEDRPFHVLVDLPGMYRTFDSLRELRRNGALILPGHDHEVTSRFPLAYPTRSAFTYRIQSTSATPDVAQADAATGNGSHGAQSGRH